MTDFKKKWVKYLILYKPARWVVTQLFFVTMLFSIMASVMAFNQNKLNGNQADAAAQGYDQVLTIKANHVSDYIVDNESYYLIESDTDCILLTKNAIFHDDIRENRTLTICYKTSQTVSMPNKSADLLDAYCLIADEPIMTIIWYIACGAWGTAMLVCIVTLTVVDLKAQHDERQKSKGAVNHGKGTEEIHG